MKEYKPFFGTSVFIFFPIFILLLPMMGLGVEIANIGSANYNPGYIVGLFLLSTLGVIGFLFLIVVVINFFAFFIPNKKLYLSNEVVYYKEKTLPLNEITNLALSLPQVISRNNVTPMELCIWVNDHDFILFKNPPLSLILKLKKVCKNARFSIDNKEELTKDFILCAIFAFVTFIFCLFFKGAQP